MKLFPYPCIFQLLIVFTIVSTYKQSVAAEQTNQPAIPFLNLIAQAKTNYEAGVVSKAREEINQFLELNELDALRGVLNLERQVADFCISQGDSEHALTILERGLQIVENTVGSDHSEMLVALASIGVFHLKQGDAARALPIFQRCLTVSEKNFGNESLEVAGVSDAIATCHAMLYQLPQATMQREKSLAIREKILGSDNPFVLNTRGELAALYGLQGQSALALPLLEKNVYQQEGVLGKDIMKALTEVDTALRPTALSDSSRTNAMLLAGCYDQLCQAERTLGKYGQAMELARRCHRLNESLFGPESPAVAGSLMVQAAIQSEQDRQQHDELVLPFLEKALRILEKNFGKDDPRLTTVLNNLGLANGNVGRDSAALDCFERALAIFEKTYGKDCMASTTLLMNLAVLHRERGEYAIALPLHRRSVELSERYFGKGHLTTVLAACHLAIWDIKQGIFPSFIFEENGASSAWRKFLPTRLPLLADADAEAMIDKLSFFTEGMLSIGDMKNLKGANAFPRYAAEGLAMGKALLEEASCVRIGFDGLPDGRPQRLRDAYKALQIQLFVLTETTISPEEMRKKRDALEAELFKMEANLGDISQAAEKSLRESDWTLIDVARAIPSDAVLVDFAQYRRWDYNEANKNFKEQKYAVYLTFPLARDSTNVVVERVDLGEAAPINEAVELVCKRMSAGQIDAKDLSPALQRLSQLVYAPLAPHLTNVSHLIVCPDGQLSRLPFEMLPVGNKFLIEEKTISYVTSGREIVRLKSRAGVPPAQAEEKSPADPDRRDALSYVNGKSLVMGNPDFDLDLGSARDRSAAVPSRSTSDKASATELSQRAANFVAAAAEDSRAPLKSLSRDFRGLKFLPLPGSGVEATNVAKLLGNDATLRLGAEAREAELKAVLSPRVLHLATHGFYLPDQEFKQTNSLRDSLPENFGTRWNTSLPRNEWENPLVRCGVALAGANHARQITNAIAEDGLLTGLEASLLNLQGTELVILSACDSGTGEVKIGEGVMSLRRAFRIAGAETVLASHWKVSDKATSRLMTEFMRRWRAGEPRAKAWREAQLSLLRSKGAKEDFSNPYFWSAFTLTGQWN